MDRDHVSEARFSGRRIDSGVSDSDEETHHDLPPLFSEAKPKTPTRERMNNSGTMAKQRMVNDDSFMASSRSPPKRFSALSIGGTMLTEYAIGGYEIDLGEVAEAAREVVPLPPSQLPVIFADQELNFYHHFFRALRDALGEGLMQFVLAKDCNEAADETPLSDMVEDMVSIGYERTDNEFQILLKKIVSTTFSLEGQRGRKIRSGPIRVRANLWGFQYIEAGMRCEESDLEMWINMSYMYYRTSWFNTFKLTGIPAFAIDAELKKHGRFRKPSKSSEFNEGLKMLEHPLGHKNGDQIMTHDVRSKYGESVRSSRTSRRHQSGGKWTRKKQFIEQPPF